MYSWDIFDEFVEDYKSFISERYEVLDNISDFSESKEVHREPSSNNYRADIIIEWKNDCYSHVEVKINDKNLSKTYKTRQEMMKKFEAEETKWTDFILLLPDGLSLWEASEEASNKFSNLRSSVCICGEFLAQYLL